MTRLTLLHGPYRTDLTSRGCALGYLGRPEVLRVPSALVFRRHARTEREKVSGIVSVGGMLAQMIREMVEAIVKHLEALLPKTFKGAMLSHTHTHTLSLCLSLCLSLYIFV